MLEKIVELLEPYMSGEACDAESGSCELADCRTCDAIALANRLVFHDVVPVVRCKNCKHRNFTGVAPFMYHCCGHDDGLVGKVNDDDFCSYGERKVDA